MFVRRPGSRGRQHPKLQREILMLVRPAQDLAAPFEAYTAPLAIDSDNNIARSSCYIPLSAEVRGAARQKHRHSFTAHTQITASTLDPSNFAHASLPARALRAQENSRVLADLHRRATPKPTDNKQAMGMIRRGTSLLPSNLRLDTAPQNQLGVAAGHQKLPSSLPYRGSIQN